MSFQDKEKKENYFSSFIAFWELLISELWVSILVKYQLWFRNENLYHKFVCKETLVKERQTLNPFQSNLKTNGNEQIYFPVKRHGARSICFTRFSLPADLSALSSKRDRGRYGKSQGRTMKKGHLWHRTIMSNRWFSIQYYDYYWCLACCDCWNCEDT